MSLSSKKPDNFTQNNNNSLSGIQLPVRVMDDSQWFFIRKSFRMSPRELIVAKFVCGGLSNEEIAKHLGIKTATIKTHLRNIYRRIGVQRKLDMLLIFLDMSSKHLNAASAKPANTPKTDINTAIGNQSNLAGH
jgi:DNA-binding CsgD family transcriptional regulator